MPGPTFTTRTMLGVFIYFAVSFACIRYTFFSGRATESWEAVLMLVSHVVGGASFGAGIGTLFRKDAMGAIIGAISATFFLILFMAKVR